MEWAYTYKHGVYQITNHCMYHNEYADVTGSRLAKATRLSKKLK